MFRNKDKEIKELKKRIAELEIKVGIENKAKIEKLQKENEKLKRDLEFLAFVKLSKGKDEEAKGLINSAVIGVLNNGVPASEMLWDLEDVDFFFGKNDEG